MSVRRKVGECFRGLSVNLLDMRRSWEFERVAGVVFIASRLSSSSCVVFFVLTGIARILFPKIRRSFTRYDVASHVHLRFTEGKHPHYFSLVRLVDIQI